MTLELFFRYTLMTLFSNANQKNLKETIFGKNLTYDNYYFHVPRIYAMDGWNISIQINYGNYCSSENGYRKFGHTMITAEWGFPSEFEPEFLDENGEKIDDVGSMNVDDLQKIFDRHGGINWEETLSVDVFNQFVHNKSFVKPQKPKQVSDETEKNDLPRIFKID